MSVPLATGLIAASTVAAVAVLSGASYSLAVVSASAAADNAALAAADAFYWAANSDPCAVAEQIAAANNTVLLNCERTTSVIFVTVQMRGGMWEVRRSARAG